MQLPKCIDSVQKFNYWLNFSSTSLNNFRTFIEFVLVPDIPFDFFPNGMVTLFEHFAWYVKGRNPELVSDINNYMDIMKSVINEVYREHVNSKQKIKPT